MTIFTIGYEGSDIDQFVETLQKNKMKCLIDVRKNPVSRKKGFSKSKLAQALAAEGIEYLHYGDLGVPSAWRKEAKAEIITREKMFKKYAKEILPIHQDKIDEIIRIAKKRRSVLLCYEHNALDCHRHYLTERIKKQIKVKIVDLEVEDFSQGPRLYRPRTTANRTLS
ncbi:DUF488 family protein [Bdellovibrio sp. HCB2-146]|uniref:DUF488 domain-containing protein n=1 Tax=Bdellovibrio sp. HCB2-146 TaxID=3394362 RepID=UPI0039BCAD2C